jgi:hypothetical protein
MKGKLHIYVLLNFGVSVKPEHSILFQLSHTFSVVSSEQTKGISSMEQYCFFWQYNVNMQGELWDFIMSHCQDW